MQVWKNALQVKRLLVIVPLVIILTQMVIVALSVVLQWQQHAWVIECANQMKQIGLALRSYHDSHCVFPPAQMNGHSWRVRLEPERWQTCYIEYYRFDESYDSEWNQNLETKPLPDKHGDIGRLPSDGIRYRHAYFLWQCPGEQVGNSPHTNYLMLVGPNAFGLPNRGRQLSEITDDPATTIAVAETVSRDIGWLEPKDFDAHSMSYQINDPQRPSISSRHRHGANVVFVNGDVALLSPDLPPEVLLAMVTINGGEKIVQDESAPGGYRLVNRAEAVP